MYSAFRDRGICFENDIYDAIDKKIKKFWNYAERKKYLIRIKKLDDYI